MSFRKVFERMEERHHHKLIVGDGFVWDAREEKLYGNPKNALGRFGGSEDNDEDVLGHYASIRMAVRPSDDGPDLLNRVPCPWMAQNDDSELFDCFAEAIWKNGANIDANMWLGNYQYQKISIGRHASMETITDHKTSRQVVKMVVDENGYGRVFLRYLGFDQDSFSRAYDEINY